MRRDFAKWGFFVFVMGSLVPGAVCLGMTITRAVFALRPKKAARIA